MPARICARSSPWWKSMATRPLRAPSRTRSPSTPSPASTSLTCCRRGPAQRSSRSAHCPCPAARTCSNWFSLNRICPSTRPKPMSDEYNTTNTDADQSIEPLSKLLMRLQLSNARNHYHELAQTAADQGWSHLEYLQRLVEREIAHRDDKSLERRVRVARFPLFKTLDQFQWSWPKKINRPQIQNLFHLKFIEQKANVLFMSGTPGLGITHLSIALGRTACTNNNTEHNTTANIMILTLSAAAAVGAGELQHVMQRYLKP